MTDKETIITRVKALRARASDEASSPAEVAAAAQRAAKLISKHELTEADLRDTATNGVTEGNFDSDRRTRSVALEYAAQGIGSLTECLVLWRGAEACAFGLPSDVEFALYLFELVTGAANRGWKAYYRKLGYRPGPASRNDYMRGFGRQVTIEFCTLAADRRSARKATKGTSLLVMKNTLIAAHIAERIGEVLPPPKSRKGRRWPDARAALAGHMDGARISPTRPIETDEPQEAIQ